MHYGIVVRNRADGAMLPNMGIESEDDPTRYAERHTLRSPCLECERRNMDKTECAETCERLAAYQKRLVCINIGSQASNEFDSIPGLKRSSQTIDTIQKERRAIDGGATCSINGCTEPAICHNFKNQYDGLLCQKHYMRFYSRWRRTGRITRLDGEL